MFIEVVECNILSINIPQYFSQEGLDMEKEYFHNIPNFGSNTT